MFDNFRNMAGLLGQAKQFRAQLEQMQAELARKTVEGDAGAGAVRVVINGRFEVQSVHLDPAMLAPLLGGAKEEDQRLMEDLIAAAVNDALTKAREAVQQEITRLTGGLSIPGIEKLLGP